MKKTILIALTTFITACGGAGGNVSTLDNSEASSNNDSVSNAQFVELDQLIKGSASTTDNDDYFSIAVIEGLKFQVNLTSSSQSDLDLTLLNDESNSLDFSDEDFSNESITHTAGYTGMHYIHVEHFDGDAVSYDLKTTVSNSSAVQFNAIACVEDSQAGQVEFAIISGTKSPSSLAEGNCPPIQHVSKCVVSNSIGRKRNIYFTQAYVDDIGGHANVERDVCGDDPSIEYIIY